MSGQVIVTADNRSPVVNLVSWVSTAVLCLASLAKLYNNFQASLVLSRDSVLVLVATLFAIGQCVAVSEAATLGLGQRKLDPSSSDFVRLQKFEYANQLLYIFTVGFGKLAIWSFLSTLAITASRRMMTRAAGVLTAVWMVIGVFGVAFQCRTPQFWEIASRKCFNQASFWQAIAVIDILIDITLIFLPILFLRNLNITRKKRVHVMLAFSTRVIVIPTTVLRAIYMSTAFTSSNPTFELWKAEVLTSVNICANIAAASLPFLKSVMENVELGLFSSDLRVAPGTRKGSSSGGSYPLSSLSRYGRRIPGASARWQRSVYRSENSTKRDPGSTTQGISRTDSSASNRLIIAQTKEFSVQHTDTDGACS